MSRCEKCGEIVDWSNPNIHYGGHVCSEQKVEVQSLLSPTAFFTPVGERYCRDCRFSEECQTQSRSGIACAGFIKKRPENNPFISKDEDTMWLVEERATGALGVLCYCEASVFWDYYLFTKDNRFKGDMTNIGPDLIKRFKPIRELNRAAFELLR